MAKKKLKKVSKPIKPKKVGIEIIDLDEPMISDHQIGKFYQGLAEEVESQKSNPKKRGRPSKSVETQEEAKGSMEKTEVPAEETSQREVQSGTEKIENHIDLKFEKTKNRCVLLLQDLEIPFYHWDEFLFDLGVYFKNMSFDELNYTFGSIFVNKYFPHKKEKESK